jgi:BirA family biotin operon repressor/biotin-[acetyl-CoA-carboxylase] ligase
VLSGYSLACGIALHKALASIHAGISLKWPNDLVVCTSDGLKKLGGILIEVEPNRGFHCVLVGVGINVTSPPQDLGLIATSVTQLRRMETSVEEVLLPTSREFLQMHRRFVSEDGFAGFFEEWSSASCFRPGITAIGIDTGLGEVAGVYDGIDSSGALILRVNGVRRQFISGHITSLKM